MPYVVGNCMLPIVRAGALQPTGANVEFADPGLGPYPQVSCDSGAGLQRIHTMGRDRQGDGSEEQS